MNVDFIKSIRDAELRIEMLAKILQTNFFTEPTIQYFFNEDEVEKLIKKGILAKVEGYLLNKKVIWHE